jgi:hypothetical protein
VKWDIGKPICGAIPPQTKAEMSNLRWITATLTLAKGKTAGTMPYSGEVLDSFLSQPLLSIPIDVP